MDPKICVVTLIGKSQLVHNQTKAWKLNFLIRRNYFQAGNANVQSSIFRVYSFVFGNVSTTSVHKENDCLLIKCIVGKEPSPADASSSVKRNKENEKSNTFDDVK